ncbi:3-ketoacyl-ACP reductase [uncultured Roseovarius sp.]|uniref:3-ketoacyl-ACP reductase n=1 Tax=Roseovarius sp. TaxID=1486281 RepID=UPI0025D05A90|nr:3-ketoacyl-ACP reductase [uncultured Roseovarius sp.]
MEQADLKARLDALGRNIERAEERLKLKHLFSADHQIKASELRERYRVLCRKVQAEVAREEAHGRHVSNLERSLREWWDSFELDAD